MHTGMTGITHTLFGRPCMVNPTEHLHPRLKHISIGRAIQKYKNITLHLPQFRSKREKQNKNNNSQGLDKLNIRHQKYIGLLGLAFLTIIFKTALNNNIIPSIWKLANIAPIPNPNKDIDKGTSYRSIYLLLLTIKTLEKSLLPYITANIPNTHTQHW